ncbi:beta-xylosidase-like protein [Elsinoe australis]|uniref:Beta-xylosidase-like protein n=1 Tax=Elsinoe australis TaxID=40998 RepID=A0A4U7B6J9_9PEZI|nr:beta-xylosidase-like protein [Elsinoe australis]
MPHFREHPVNSPTPQTPPLGHAGLHDPANSYQPKRETGTRVACSMLHVDGRNIVNETGQAVILKGAGLGGHLNMENFVSGYPGHEYQFRQALADTIGADKAEYYFDRYLYHFFTEQDAEFFASLGLNCVRVPFNYQHFINDSNPEIIKQKGFEYLDRVVEICARHNLYAILDLHTAPGGQNQDWHCDSGSSQALFWEFRALQDQMIDLWVEIAKHYIGNPVVAGYNVLNEPADEKHIRLQEWYARVEKAIRGIDPDHILFLEGNTYSMDFTHFKDLLPNAVYACHDYSKMGFPIAGQTPYGGSQEQKTKLRSQFERKVSFMREHKVPIWNGEFGPVYADPSEDKDADTTNLARYRLLQEQLRLYAESDVHWTIWLYKDIGYQGMVFVDPESAYMKLIKPFVKKKQALALDFWGSTSKDQIHEDVYAPFFARMKQMVPEHLQGKKYPKIFNFERQFERVIRECLLSEYMVWEFAELFKDKTEQELDELAQSFRLEHCVKRQGLNNILRHEASL